MKAQTLFVRSVSALTFLEHYLQRQIGSSLVSETEVSQTDKTRQDKTRSSLIGRYVFLALSEQQLPVNCNQRINVRTTGQTVIGC